MPKHLPDPSATLFLLLGIATVRRNKHKSKRDPFGWKWCEAKNLGPLHEVLGEPFMDGIIPLSPAERELQEARDILGAHCRACGGCRWGRLMPPTPQIRPTGKDQGAVDGG